MWCLDGVFGVEGVEFLSVRWIFVIAHASATPLLANIGELYSWSFSTRLRHLMGIYNDLTFGTQTDAKGGEAHFLHTPTCLVFLLSHVASLSTCRSPSNVQSKNR